MPTDYMRAKYEQTLLAEIKDALPRSRVTPDLLRRVIEVDADLGDSMAKFQDVVLGMTAVAVVDAGSKERQVATCFVVASNLLHMVAKLNRHRAELEGVPFEKARVALGAYSIADQLDPSRNEFGELVKLVGDHKATRNKASL
jgi:hypothetical protein